MDQIIFSIESISDAVDSQTYKQAIKEALDRPTLNQSDYYPSSRELLFPKDRRRSIFQALETEGKGAVSDVGCFTAKSSNSASTPLDCM